MDQDGDVESQNDRRSVPSGLAPPGYLSQLNEKFSGLSSHICNVPNFLQNRPPAENEAPKISENLDVAVEFQYQFVHQLQNPAQGPNGGFNQGNQSQIEGAAEDPFNVDEASGQGMGMNGAADPLSEAPDPCGDLYGGLGEASEMQGSATGS